MEKVRHILDLQEEPLKVGSMDIIVTSTTGQTLELNCLNISGNSRIVMFHITSNGAFYQKQKPSIL